ncbi:DUF6037 family protein [Lacticaseibacillus saniviri]|uniref:DUF6037 family protein n=1 Tax=Lacticaseibacillus saniviri TaxID=931533 RepID=UPI000A5E683C|nr:DUF6037 family protein [Lacticaseibacillus saniviri]
MYGFQLGSEAKRRLIFNEFNSQEELSLNIDDEFKVNTFLPEQYYEIREFFEIETMPDSTTFKLFDLYRAIDGGIHVYILRIDNRTQVSRAYGFPNPHAIYYNGMIRHDLNGDGKHASDANKAKVKHLLPTLYEMIKDRNISVRFSSETGKTETRTQYRTDME